MKLPYNYLLQISLLLTLSLNAKCQQTIIIKKEKPEEKSGLTDFNLVEMSFTNEKGKIVQKNDSTIEIQSEQLLPKRSININIEDHNIILNVDTMDLYIHVKKTIPTRDSTAFFQINFVNDQLEEWNYEKSITTTNLEPTSYILTCYIIIKGQDYFGAIPASWNPFAYE